MSDGLNISDAALEAAGNSLVAASSAMTTANAAVPAGDFSSLSGIGGEVRAFLHGLQTGRLALADAAKTAAREVAAVMSESSRLDARMAEALSSGFALRGGRR
ncbi:hypothetical protein [Leucobacter massiliensis]|uniref:Uncharacterized protein n=1 Tax=Leucobacter massiliensis TaxID=1686285 RepID=A0A2S9QLV8_9MICO|nr:hypothetical protein [Leucobacter massiliensis]PRI10567.1 hypothetical protein B4915_11250 [Leucobacter massiliensis]